VFRRPGNLTVVVSEGVRPHALGKARDPAPLPQDAPRWHAAEVLVPLAALVLVGIIFLDGLRPSDLLVFLRAARDVTHGVNPYTATDNPFLWGGSAFVYPYLTAFLFVPLTWVTVPVAEVTWFAVSGAAVAVACRLLGLRDPWGIAAVLLSATCIRSLQVGALNGLLLLAAAVLWRFRHRTGVAAAALTLLAGSKLFLLPMTVWVLLTRPRRTVLASAVALGSFLGLSLLLQPISVLEFLTATRLLAQHEGPHSMSTLHLASAVFSASTANLLPLLLGGGVLLGGVAYRLRHWESGDAVLFASAVVASLLATPIYWSHYTLLVLAVVLLARPTRAAALVFAASTWLVAPPALFPHLPYSPPLDLRLVVLYGGMVLAVLVTARRSTVECAVVEEVGQGSR
jgi:alpha-1,2-mannosyltransferase